MPTTFKTTWVNGEIVNAAYFNDLGAALNSLGAPGVSLILSDAGSPAKQATFDVSGITAGQTRNFVLPDSSGTLVTLAANQSLSNKTLISPVLSSPVVNGVFDGSGNELLDFVSVGAAVNELQVSNAVAGSGPILGVAGGDANTGMTISPKGSGRVAVVNLSATNPILTSPKIVTGVFDANGANSIQIPATASAVNSFILRNSAAGGYVNIEASGSDTNVGINIVPKGSSRVNITSLTTTFPQINSGLSDANYNNMLVFSPTTSAVNYIQIQNAATTGNPSFKVQGSDTTINFDFYSKGVGYIAFRDGSANPILQLSPAASGVNWLQILSGATGSPGAVTMQAAGSDANVNVNIWAKGTGQVTLRANGAIVFAAAGVASAVSYLYTYNAASSAGSPGIQVQSTDTNVGIVLQPKGSGNVQIYAGTGQEPGIQATGVDANVNLGLWPKGTGSVVVRNGLGNPIMQFLTATLPVNYWQFANSPTGGSLGASVVGSDANINIAWQTKGSGQHLFRNADSTTSFAVSPTASAANYLTAYGAAAGNAVILGPVGTDTDIQTLIRSKGAGTVTIRDGNNAQILQCVPVASAVNLISITNAVAGSAPNIYANGADTDIQLRLRSKGIGAVILADGSNNAMLVASTTANAVNYIQTLNAATTGFPQILANGADTNISLLIGSKGTGSVIIRGGSTTILKTLEISSAVNYLQISNNVTGSGPTIQPVGSDTDIALNITSKGGGGMSLQAGVQKVLMGSAIAGFEINRDNTSVGILTAITSAGLTGSSGVQYGLSIQPTITQSGTAGYTMLRVNPTESSIGTGARLLADFQLGGVSKVGITPGGSISAVGTIAGYVVKTNSAATGSRPAATGYGAGSMFYDSTLSKPIWSDGSVWRDAAGTAV